MWDVGRPEVTWLDGGFAVDAHDVGERAVTLARLRTAGLPALRAFAIGRRLLETSTSSLRGDAGALQQLPHDVADMVLRALRQMGGPVAVRRSPLPGATGGRQAIGEAQREFYLHLMHPTDVLEAVRRLWSEAITHKRPTAVVVQRFVVPDSSARLREEDDVLIVEATYGVGDLLAQNLVVPDRFRVDRAGAIVARKIGRKSQMTIPRTDGGVARVPVPVESSRELSVDDATIAEMIALYRRVEAALGPIERLSLSIAGSALSITSALLREVPRDEMELA